MLVRPAADGGKPVPDRESLREMRLLLLEEGHCFRDQALSFCAPDTGTGTTTPREMMDGSSLSTLVQMVGAGIGVTLIPEMAVPVETRSAPVSVAAFPDPQPRRTLGLVWRRTSPRRRSCARSPKWCARWRSARSVQIAPCDFSTASSSPDIQPKIRALPSSTCTR
ncbi:hypothetical protein MASR1M32_24220 [Rhodobacter sp.]